MADKTPPKSALDLTRLKPAGHTVGTIIYILFGPIVWAVHLLLIYGFQSAGCALTGYSRDLAFYGTWGIVLITAIAALKLGFAAVRPNLLERSLGADVWTGNLRAGNRAMMRLLAGLSIYAILASGLAPLIVPICASLR
jgi:hypothetical protein